MARASLGRARSGVATLGLEATLHEAEVRTAAAAVARGMHGSPTIFVDGTDPFAPPGEEPSLSCRRFTTPDSVDGAPTVAQLVGVLASGEHREGATYGPTGS